MAQSLSTESPVQEWASELCRRCGVDPNTCVSMTLRFDASDMVMHGYFETVNINTDLPDPPVEITVVRLES